MPKIKKEKKVGALVVGGGNKVKLVSYEIKAVIPTGAYQNIQPCIVVEASTLEEAQAYVMPHINKMFKEFMNCNEKICSPERPAPDPVVPSNPKQVKKTAEVSEKSSSYINAEKAINSANTAEALSVVQKRITDSKNLTDEEKKELTRMNLSKINEVQGK